MGNVPIRPKAEEAEQLVAAVDAACVTAAELIAGADVLLLATGAGFSADSGLAVYRDIAKIEAYQTRGLHYHDICVPQWLEDDKALFWGFWGRCFNDYRETKPHAGYEILAGWRDRHFASSEFAARVRRRLEAEAATVAAEREPYEVGPTRAGAFFVFTSNVDAHHFDAFHAHEIRECHGNTELYQCAERCCKKIWRAPLDWRFEVDAQTMLAPAARSEQEPSECGEPGAASLEAAPADGPAVIGATRGSSRPRKTLLRSMPRGRHAHPFTNHPRCPRCEGDARPAILMFNDREWLDSKAQLERYAAWCLAVRAEATECETPLKIVILEIGAGDNVTTVRAETEHVFRKADNCETTLVRVNPELPLGDADPEHLREGKVTVLSIMSRGLVALEKIDAAMPRLEPGYEPL